MTRGLAIETSGRTGSAALVEDGISVAEDQFPHGLRHAAELVPMIDRLCRARGWGPRDLRRLYVSVGPGSFTGLRVGVTVAKTLAFATGARVVAVPTADVLARNAPPEATNAVIVLDAKRGQIFTARFGRPSPAEPWSVEEPARLDTLAAVLARTPRPVHLIGEGIPYHRDAIPADDPGVIVTSEALWRARAVAVAEVGHEMARDGLWTGPHALTPLYVRRPEAEEVYDARHGGVAAPGP